MSKIPVAKCGMCGAVKRRVGEWTFCLLCDCPAGTLAAMKAVGDSGRTPIVKPPPSEPGE